MQRLPAGIKAVFFDMDGTLIDSEPLTDKAVQTLIDACGLPPPSFPLGDLHGKTWERIAEDLVSEYPELGGKSLAGRMQSDFDLLLRKGMPKAIPGAVEAFEAASRACIAGIVSSSPRATVEFVAGKLGLSNACLVLVGAENVRHSKPHPECYLVAASHAHVRPSECLAFEDSEAGLEAAAAAGLVTVGVRGKRDDGVTERLSRLTPFVIVDYEALPDDFFPSAPAS